MSELTQHSINVGHGFDTPHKYPFSVEQPEDEVQLIELNNLTNQLYPTGRAWYKPENGSFEALHQAINLSFLKIIEDYKQLIDSSLPDNENFTSDDATFLEYKFGLRNGENINSQLSESISLEIRKSAIKRKMGHPNNIKARQHRLFLETQLQLSGFNVYVHENTPPYLTPQDLIGLVTTPTEHANDTEHGNSTFHGTLTGDVIANQIEPESYGTGEDNLWASFFIGGQTLGDTADVSESRRREFRELVLKLKPAHLAAYLVINYT